MQIKLTIIIPHYNTVKLAIGLLKTIPDVSWLRIIIVDDKSSEDITALEDYVSSRLNSEIVKNETSRKGAGTCRNIGLKMVSSGYVLFADSDDFFLPDLEEAVIPYLDSRIDVVFFHFTSIYLDTGKEAARHINFTNVLDAYHNHPGRVSELYLRYAIPNPVCKMIDISFLNEYGIIFDETIVSNDVMFSTKVGFHMNNFVVADKVIYCATRGANSLTTTVSESIFDTRFSVFLRYAVFLKTHILPQEFKKLRISGVHHILRSRVYGIRKTLKIISTLLRNGIPLVSLKGFSFNKIFFHAKKVRKEKRYYSQN